MSITALGSKNQYGHECVWEVSLSKAITQVEQGSATCHLSLEELRTAHRNYLGLDFDPDVLSAGRKWTLMTKLITSIVIPACHKAVSACSFSNKLIAALLALAVGVIEIAANWKFITTGVHFTSHGHHYF